jgi:hypothetical protein
VVVTLSPLPGLTLRPSPADVSIRATSSAFDPGGGCDGYGAPLVVQSL